MKLKIGPEAAKQMMARIAALRAQIEAQARIQAAIRGVT